MHFQSRHKFVFFQSFLGVLFLLLSFKLCGQAFDKTFSGQWASTSWKFEFHQDGTFRRTSTGHFGNPVYEGTYVIRKDTVQMLSGFASTWGTVNEYYLIYKDSLLIDLELLYDYALDSEPWQHISKKRYDILKKPAEEPNLEISRAEFEELLKQSSEILRNKPVIELNDEENIQIIRLINTGLFVKDTVTASALYADFMNLLRSRNYVVEIQKNYDHGAGKGMGIYFRKLQVNLAGAPVANSLYHFR